METTQKRHWYSFIFGSSTNEFLLEKTSGGPTYNCKGLVLMFIIANFNPMSLRGMGTPLKHF